MTAVNSTSVPIKTPWHLWLVGVVAVLFNAIGVFDFVMSMTQGAAYMGSAGMTPAQIDHYQQMPAWMTAVWALGVFGAFAGSVLILLRNKLAWPVLAVSLAAFLLSVAYTYVLTDGGAIMGQQMAITSAVIAGLLALFIAYSRWMTRRGVLR
jgi:membrane-bound acyltransferase YfiQ involved in biofilm formation